MQRITAFLFVIFLAILGSGCATTTSAPVREGRVVSTPRPAPPATPIPSNVPSVPGELAVAKPTPPVPIGTPTLAEKAPTGKPDTSGAHIGLLLPLNSPAFRQPAEAVKQGVLAAAKAQPDMPAVRIYPTTDQVANILAAYRQATEAGARVMIGPLTKNAVAALAESDMTAVPTLALSVPENEIASANLYLFGLSLEADARQVAQLAASEGRSAVLIVAANNAVGKRLQMAFSDEWQRLGGKIVGQLSFTPTTDLNTLRDKLEKLPADSIFLAANAQEARMVRPYILTATPTPTYATSQAFGGVGEAQRNVDLAGVRFLDMPWLLQPDHAAVMIYPRAEKNTGVDSERLYAMGIDAYRLAQLFYRGEMPTRGVVLDGVTGQISLAPGRQFTRDLTAAEFQADVIVVIDDVKP